MKRINFKKLSAKNFLSIGTAPVVIDFVVGLNVITGDNRDKEDRRNGVGKSAIADALYFAVFGSTLRDIKKEDIGNNQTLGKCEVALDLTIDTNNTTQQIRIERTLDPAKVAVIIDGTDKTLDSIASNNDFISKLIGCTPEIFENCITMTINNALPFMSKKKQDKRKFIESIFNLEIFSRMLVEAKAEYTQHKKDLDVAIGKLEENESALKTLLHQQQTSHEGVKTQRESMASKLKEATERKDALVLKRDKIDLAVLTAAQEKIQDAKTQTTDALNTTLSNVAACNTKISELIATRNEVLRTINKINGNIDKCPTCLKHVTELDKGHIQHEKTLLETRATDLLEEINSKNTQKQEYESSVRGQQTQLADYNQRLAKIEGIRQSVPEMDSQIASLTREIVTYTESINSTTKQTNSFDTLIATHRQKIETLTAESAAIKQKLQILDQVKYVFSEEGVKAFLVKRVLDLFNNRLAYYLQKMDANCTCVFNEYFEEQVVNDKGKACSYFNFSSAERKNIDLACLFTFMDIRRLQGDVSFNVSMYDELLDTSLDSKGIELVTGILQERIEKYEEAIYIISHRKESALFATGEVVYLVKNNGSTQRIPYNIV